MSERKFSVLIIFMLFVSQVICIDHTVVKIESGAIKGEATALGYEFRGIPYAEPPVGLLRYANPQKYSKTWDGVKDCTKFGSKCAQFNHFVYDFGGEEDCLFLNVYVPRLVKEGSTKAPVIFFIHGGAFMFGSGMSYGPENFMSHQKMILVTINYRLGVLGFLSTEDKAIPGNFGLKDQVEALKWVQRNIEAFNGDPKKVTITGFSAGGASVHLHYMSPLSDGLFNNGISHSGNALDPWVMMENAGKKAEMLGTEVGCETVDDHVKLLKCLRTKDTKDLVMFAKRYQVKQLYLPFSPFGVVVEPKNESAFITDRPVKYMENGKYKSLPWILSQVEDEGLYPASEFATESLMKWVDQEWMQWAGFLLDFQEVDAQEEEKLSWKMKIRTNYFEGDAISIERYFDFRQMMTDRFFHRGAYKTLQHHLKKSDTYFYFFKAETLNILPIDPHWKVPNFLQRNYDFVPYKSLGISHGDDVFLIYFNLLSRGPNKYPFTDNESNMSKNFLDMYYSFAMTGKPTFGETKLKSLKNSDKIISNEILSADSVVEGVLNSTFGAIDFWDTLQINDN